MEEVRRILSGYMRPSSSPDEDVAAETASSVSAIAAAIAANRAAATAPEPIQADVPALALGIWRPWGVGLGLRLSDVLEVISYDFN